MHVIQRFAQYLIFLCLLFVSGPVLGQSIQMQADSSKIYAGMPFTLSMVLSDFEESPQPEIDPFEIADAAVKLIGVQPRVSSMTTIINGRRSSRKEVSFVFSYEVTPNREGVFEIPVVTARQGTLLATSQGRATFEAREVETTRDMRIELQLPKRELWVGETFDATLLWSLRTSVSGQVFSLPLYSMPDYFEVEEPKLSGSERVLYLNAGQRTIPYAFSEETVMIDGLEYRQFRTQLRVTALKSGTIALPASTVLADLSVGRQMDPFGFGRSEYAFYKAVDVERQLVVRDLPQAQRPAAFVNALGSDFEIAVAADRTIVKLGDPIMLTIDISSPVAHEGLILPSLSLAGLNEQLFSVSTEEPIGESIQAAQGRMIRRFIVPIRVKSERVKEIPPLVFVYFDPQREQYQSVRSEPIALNVMAVDKVSIDDVVMGRALGASKNQDLPLNADAENAQDRSFAPSTHLDLGLNAKDSDLKPKFLSQYRQHLMLGLYVTPFLLWAFLLGIRRSRRRVARYATQREAAKALSKALARAKTRLAGEAAAELSNALGAYLVATESSRERFASIFEELGSCAYHPEAQMRPLDEGLLETLRAKAKSDVHPKYAKTVGLILSMFLAFGLGFSSPLADAQELVEAPTKLERNVQESDALQGQSEAQIQAVEASQQGRDEISRMPKASDQGVADGTNAQWLEALHTAQALYHEAMGISHRSDRLAKFRAAAALYAQLAKAFPESAAIFVDWGNACLNASDLGCASLAYKHALRLDPSHRQAKTNRAYILSSIGEESQVQSRAFSSFFFLNDGFSREQRLLWAAFFFAIAVLLMVPWHAGSKRVLRVLSVLPFVLWIWCISSVFLEPPSQDSGVVLQELWLKTADNLGSANSSPSSLPPGMDVTIIEQRGDWLNVRALNGRQGWARQSSIGR